MVKKTLLDIHAYTKGMELYVEVKSEIIGTWVEEQRAMDYTEPLITTFRINSAVVVNGEREDRFKIYTYLRVTDPRTQDAYGRFLAGNYHIGIIDAPSSYGIAIPNTAIFTAVGLKDGLVIKVPKYVGAAAVNAYVSAMKEEALFIWKTFLKPSARKVRIYVEDVSYE